MDYQFALLSWALFLTAGVSLIVALVAWQKKETLPALYLLLLESSVVVWSIAAAFEAAATTIPLKLLWSQVSYLGISGAITSYFFLAIAFGQHRKYLVPRYILLIIAIPLLSIISVATNNWHFSFYSDIAIDPEKNIATYTHGVLFWIHTIYAYLLLVIGLAIIVRSIFRFPTFYKSQSLILMVGALFPFTGNVMYVFNLNPIPGVDWTPIAFGISGLLFAWGISRYQLLELIPTSHHGLVSAMNDGMLVLDLQGRITDINSAMQAITGISARAAMGKIAIQLLASWDELIWCLNKNIECREEIHSALGNTHSVYNLQISMIYNRQGQLTGKLVILHDITERKQAENALKVSEERFRKLFDSAQDAIMTLNPPTWKFTSGNPTIVKMFKAKNVKQFLKLGPWDVSPKKQPDGRLSSEKSKEMIEIAMTKGSNFFEWTHKRINGDS